MSVLTNCYKFWNFTGKWIEKQSSDTYTCYLLILFESSNKVKKILDWDHTFGFSWSRSIFYIRYSIIILPEDILDKKY